MLTNQISFEILNTLSGIELQFILPYMSFFICAVLLSQCHLYIYVGLRFSLLESSLIFSLVHLGFYRNSFSRTRAYDSLLCSLSLLALSSFFLYLTRLTISFIFYSLSTSISNASLMQFRKSLSFSYLDLSSYFVSNFLSLFLYSELSDSTSYSSIGSSSSV